MTSKENEYRDFYNKVGAKIGWDFSRIKVVSEGGKWDFYQKVRQRCRKDDLLLDIGTGGGERVLSLADAVHLIIGVDNSEEMIATARKNRQERGIRKARFFIMDSAKMDFPAGFFNLITCRHSVFKAREVYRLLAEGGIFMSQQVDETDKMNIKEFYGRGQSYGDAGGTACKNYIKLLQEAGFSRVFTDSYNAVEYYQTPEDLLFLLQHTPIIPDFGEEEDLLLLDKFFQQYSTPRGIKTNSSRYLIIAEK
ncbi:MAG: class I SAM-dependent methyltransferase [Halanaerobium sp.]|nr:class I SAM-dependent methyltransferase [Halanaerobium sp.]